MRVSSRPPVVWIAVSLGVGLLAGGFGGWAAHRPPALPKEYSVTGTVVGINPEHTALGFMPDPGACPVAACAGYALATKLEGARLVKNGARVRLTVVAPPDGAEILLRVSPWP
jgi:hypothetical protein